MGDYVVYVILDPADDGVPQSREIFYIFGTLIEHKPIDQLVKGFKKPMWESDFHAVLREMRITPLPISMFLAPDCHAEVVSANTQRDAEPGKAKLAKKEREGEGKGQDQQRAFRTGRR